MQIANSFIDMYNLSQLLKENDFITDKENAIDINAKTSDSSGSIEFKNVNFAYHDKNKHASSSLTQDENEKPNKNNLN